MTTLALRAYVKEKQIRERYKECYKNFDRVLILDTETTEDTYQNLNFGSFMVFFKEGLTESGLFYNSDCISKKDLQTIKKFCNEKCMKIYALDEFIERIFYPEIYYNETLCIGFNLPFDLSRLAIGYGNARGSMKNGFSFQLSRNKKYPRIKIKHIDNKMSFIKFSYGFSASGDKRYFQGNFLDLRTLTFALTNEEHSLESACELFDTEHKKITNITHGKITKRYLKYNLNDVLAAHDLFLKLKEEYEKYNLRLSITKAYSPASLGKACLGKLGIKPFLEKNPDFPSEILGYVMTTYYGGRSEVKIREKPTKVVLIDFLSMYPTVCTLQNLWRFLIADKIEYKDDTENVRKFIENITLEDLQKPDIWKMFNAIVEIEPDEDILPIRARYYDKNVYNIGVNYAKSDKQLWYTLSDAIASKLLTNKTPKIKRAIRFSPIGMQPDLHKANILGIEIDPSKDDFFKILIEKRKDIQHQMKSLNKNSNEYKLLDSKQKILKIIANATSYGIFIQIDIESKKSEVEIYGLESFNCLINKVEKFGIFYNPIVAVLITSSARLILAITETLLARHKVDYAFCDTDSMAIPLEYVKEIQDFFKPLNPYNFDEPLFKVESEIVWFYGISAKRYVLYKKKGNSFSIFKHSLHGLGYLTNPFNNEKNWQIQIWLDILKLHYGLICEKDIIEKYNNLFAISELTISTPRILERLKKINKSKEYLKQIKPFNFFVVGFGNKSENNQVIKPITPFSKNPQEAVHRDFVDYNSGEVYNGIEYWKQLSQVFFDYIEHKESKFKGDTGVLERKHIFIDNIVYIGKESNNLENVGILELLEYAHYLDKKALSKLKPKEAGIRRNTLWYIKRRIASGKPLRLARKTYTKLCGIS